MEKLTHAYTVKVTEEMAGQLEAFTRMDGCEGVSEFIRHLIASEVEKRKGHYDRLHQVFGTEGAGQKGIKECRGLPASRFHG